MDFQMDYEKVDYNIKQYNTLKECFSSDLTDVVNTIASLTDDSWKGISKDEYARKIGTWTKEFMSFIKLYESFINNLSNNLPTLENLNKEGANLEIK